MKRQPLTNQRIAMENIRRKPFRSISLIVLVLLFTASLLVGTLTSVSLGRGLQSLTNRLGADLIVAPHGAKQNINGVMLMGKPTDIYMPASNVDYLKQFPEIEQASPQLYLATMKASCCSYPVQLIGFDEDTDFIVKPWLEESYHGKLGENEVIIGHNVPSVVGDDVRYFGQTLHVVGMLDQTGMGFDSCVFMNMETAKKLAVASVRLKKNYDEHKTDLISIIMCKVKPGVNRDALALEMTDKLAKDKMFAVSSKSFTNPIAGNLRILTGYIKVTSVLLWLIAVLVLATIFSVIVNERRKEMNILRVIGATRGKLLGLILRESAIISIFGSVLGIGIGGLVTLYVLPKMSELLSIPYLIPGAGKVATYIVGCLIVGILIGPIASLYSGIKIARSDAYTSTRGM